MLRQVVAFFKKQQMVWRTPPWSNRDEDRYENARDGPGGGGLLPYVGYIGMCHVAVKGTVFKQFTVG